MPEIWDVLKPTCCLCLIFSVLCKTWKKKRAAFAIQVGSILLLLTFVVLASFIVFITMTSFASSGSDTVVTTDIDHALCKLTKTVERITRYSSHFYFYFILNLLPEIFLHTQPGLVPLHFKNRCVNSVFTHVQL